MRGRRASKAADLTTIAIRYNRRARRVHAEVSRAFDSCLCDTLRNPACTLRALQLKTFVFFCYSTITRSVAPRPKVSGWYISSAFGGGTTKTPGVVARATYE